MKSLKMLVERVIFASLIVMAMFSSYENFVSRFDHSANEVAWAGKLNSGSLKIKVAASIVAISSLLMGFLEKIMSGIKDA
jgi:uncharacterized protein (TIGR00645 family)